jgi:hypothetical protein
MLPTAIFARLIVALGLSAAALVGSTAMQAGILFRREISHVLAPQPMAILHFAPLDGGDTSLVLYSTFQVPPGPLTCYTVAGYDNFQADPPIFQAIPAPRSSWCTAAASPSGHCFLGTIDGDLYWTSAAVAGQPLTHLGQMPGRYKRVEELSCSADGSIVVAIGEQASAWNRVTSQMLWHRDDIPLRCCVFVPGAQRLIGGLQTGEVIELDALTGRTLRSISHCSHRVHWLTISSNGARLAASNACYGLSVVDLETDALLWSQEFASYSTCSAFTPDGRYLLISNIEPRIDVGIVDVASGAIIARLAGREKLILGIAIANEPTAYLWTQDTISELDLPSRTFTRHFQPTSDRTQRRPATAIDPRTGAALFKQAARIQQTVLAKPRESLP